MILMVLEALWRSEDVRINSAGDSPTVGDFLLTSDLLLLL